MTNENFSEYTHKCLNKTASENAFIFLRSRANSPADVHGGESNATTNTKSNSDPSM